MAELETISVSDIVHLYKTQFGTDAASEFSGAVRIAYCRCSQCGLSSFFPAVVGTERFYETFHRFDWYYPDEKSEFAFAASFVHAGDRVLEIGSGKGAFARYLPTRSYVGLEFSRSAIAIAAANDVVVHHDSIEEHARSNRNAYDVVCCFQVLEHVPYVRAFLNASLSALRDSGLLIISVPNADSFIRFANNNILNIPPHHQTHWSHRTLRELPSLFPLELVQLENDRLSEVHKEWYAATLLSHYLRRLLGIDERMIDTRYPNLVMSKLAHFLGSIYASIFLRSSKYLPDGHSVTAVYRKKTTADGAAL